MRIEPRLRLDDRFTHLVRASDTVVLVEDETARVLDDPLTAAVVPLLDGSWTAVDIASTLAATHAPAEVHYVLLHMLEAGLVHEVPPARAASSRSVEASGDRSGLAGALANLWRGRGAPVVTVPPEVWRGADGTHLLLADDYLRPEVAATVASPQGGTVRSVLLVAVTARRILFGPVIGPEASCIACLQDRLRLNLTGRSLLYTGAGATEAPVEVVPLPARTPDAAFDVLAGLLTDPTKPQDAEHALLVVGLPDHGRTHRHRFPRLPQCPECGDPELTVPGPRISLATRPRTVVSGGGYRIVPPEETLSRYDHLVSPLVGVVRRIEKVAAKEADLVHVYTASHAHHYGRGTVRAVKDERRDHSGGKGKTDADARASALCESLERFSSVHRGDEPVRLARRSGLGTTAEAPNDLMHFSAAQYEEREAWNAEVGRGFQFVPPPYDDEAIAWSEALDLASGRVRYVPSAFLYHGFDGAGARFCDGDSNGLAGGNCLEEAILQGFLELVERDAVALWWYNRTGRPEVVLDANDPWVREVVALYDRLDRNVWVLDLTTDLGIPTYAALSARRRDTEQDIIFGFGAHLDAHIAVTRALTELNQMLPTVLQTREERRRRLLPDFEDAVRWWDEATLEGEPYLLPARCTARWPVASSRSPEGDLLEDVRACVERAAAVGCDVLVHDLTRPDVGFPVVKVIVPGLRHFWRRLGPGRLYDVPVRLGWVERRLEEDALNPRSVFV